MKMKKAILCLILCLVWFTGFAFANDGVFYVQGSTLLPLQETQVELRKEILKFYIKDFEWMDVDVDFTFYNPGNEKTVTVGFVTPPASGDVDEDEDIHPQIENFTVNVNGKDLKYEMKRMKDTSFQAGNQEINGYDFVYYFPVTFQKGTNKIRHTYRFRGGGSVETQRDFNYQITTGKRWANKQIDDFELQIHPDLGIFFVPLSFYENGTPATWKINGEGKLSDPKVLFFSEGKPNMKLFQIKSGYLSLNEKNFKPDKDIMIGEVNWNMGWHERLCKDKNKCPKVEEIGSNLFAYFTISPSEYFEEENLAELSKRDLQIVRNFAYAIRGYDFKTVMLKDFYSQFFWYQPNPDLKLSDIKLSDKEEVFMKKVLNIESKK